MKKPAISDRLDLFVWVAVACAPMFKLAVQSAFNRFGFSLVRTRTLQRLAAGIHSVDGHDMIGAPADAGLSIAAAAVAEAGPEMDYLRQTIKPGMTVVDLGANVGLYTLQFARLVGEAGKVFAFEPGPLSYGLLKANLALNRYRNVTVENAAVSDVSGATILLLCPTGESDNRIAGFAPLDREAVPVEVVRLDDYFAPGTRVDFIKLDIQGAEVKAIEGMQRVLSDNPAIVLLVEANPSVAETLPRMGLKVEGFGSDLLVTKG